MSFYLIARYIRQSERTFGERRAGFRSCLQGYSYLCCQSHGMIYERFAREFGFNDKVPDASERLLAALDALEQERAQKLERLRAFDMKRVRAKMRGRRTLSNIERAELDAIQRGD